MTDMSRTIPPTTGAEPPKGEDPEPRGITGTRCEDANLSRADTEPPLLGWTTTVGAELNIISFMKRGISDWSREYSMRSPDDEMMRTSSRPSARRASASLPSDLSSFAENSVGGGGGAEWRREMCGPH